jgi:cytochrome c oxidase cbb3-type subunit IV
MISGILTGVLLVTFIGLWVWAWSRRRQPDFDEAARLPLEDSSAPAQERDA